MEKISQKLSESRTVTLLVKCRYLFMFLFALALGILNIPLRSAAYNAWYGFDDILLDAVVATGFAFVTIELSAFLLNRLDNVSLAVYLAMLCLGLFVLQGEISTYSLVQDIFVSATVSSVIAAIVTIPIHIARKLFYGKK